MFVRTKVRQFWFFNSGWGKKHSLQTIWKWGSCPSVTLENKKLIGVGCSRRVPYSSEISTKIIFLQIMLILIIQHLVYSVNKPVCLQDKLIITSLSQYKWPENAKWERFVLTFSHTGSKRKRNLEASRNDEIV